MPLARIGHTMLFFAHIPKTGGTSIEQHLRQRGKIALRYAKAVDWTACSPQHYHAAIYQVLLAPGFYDHGFAVLRDPMARLQSEYQYRAMRAAKQGRDPLPGFDGWVAKVLKRYRRNPYVLDNHLRPQVEFVSEGFKLFRLEDGLDMVIRWIDDVTGGLPGDAPGDAPGAAPGAAPDQTTPWRKKSGGETPVASADTRQTVEAFYAADYELHGSLAPV